MILANVCAAETLETLKIPCMYRIHDDPAADRVGVLRRGADEATAAGVDDGGLPSPVHRQPHRRAGWAGRGRLPQMLFKPMKYYTFWGVLGAIGPLFEKKLNFRGIL